MNPRIIPLNLENLTALKSAYKWVTYKKNDRDITTEILLYRMAKELIGYKIQEALPKQEQGKWQREVTK